MGGIPTPREWHDEAQFVTPSDKAWRADAIVRNMRKQIAAKNIVPGDRKQWLNLQLTTSSSPIALGKANSNAKR